MTIHLEIDDKNAELVGRPIFEKIIGSFMNENREELIQHFPYLKDWMTIEVFDEAVEVLNRLGALLSVEYSNHSIDKNGHSLAWKVRYKDDDKKVVWTLFLDDSQGDVKVSGFGFNR